MSDTYLDPNMWDACVDLTFHPDDVAWVNTMREDTKDAV